MNRDIMERWLKDPTTFCGVFENKAFDSANFGHRVAMAYDISQWDVAVVGDTTAPDHPAYGPGWKYVLICKTRDVDEAMSYFIPRDVETEPEGRTHGDASLARSLTEAAKEAG